ncbi:MAG: hypothetical protein QOH46_2834 [Solirubrobacteraceae bacterium]|nr:hypothetical protein [Solirubrobacteraceae bacterium]
MGDLGAYGVAFADLGGPDSPEPPRTWPRWTVAQEIGPADDSPGMDVWDDRARIGMPSVGEFRLDRERRHIVVRVRERWSAEVLLHPGLAPAASVIAHWMGRAGLHAAAVTVGGRAWGLLGDKGAGKSTTAANLVGLGCGLVTDDLLVVDDMEAFAGPAALDLREDVGPDHGGQPLGVIGGRERWRAPSRIDALSAPLGGWVQLAWSDDGATTCEEVGPPGRVQALDRSTLLPPEGAHLLRLADAPMVRFTTHHAPGQARADALRLLETLRSTPGAAHTRE